MTRSLPTLTIAMARVAAQDAGNRQMRKAGRSAWNEDDFNVAAKTFVTLAATIEVAA